MQKYHILIVSPEYPPYNIGGGGIAMQGLAQGLTALGLEVSVLAGKYIVSTNSDEVEYRKDGTVSVYDLPLQKNILKNKLLDTRMPLNTNSSSFVDNYLDEHKFDFAIVMGGFEYCSAQIAAKLKQRGIAYILDFQSYYHKGHYSTLFHLGFSLYESMVLKKYHANALFTVETSQMLVPELQSVVIPNGIDVIKFQQITSKLDIRLIHNIPPHKKIIFSIGRLHRLKGFQYVIEAIKDMHDVAYIVAGPDDRYEQRLKKIASRNVIFAGPVSSELKKNYYQQCDLFIVPSLVEPFGLVGLEAMAYGKPIIANPVGGLKEYLVDGKNARLIPTQDTDYLKRTIRKLIENPEAAKKLGDQALQDVKNYDWKTIAQQFIAEYEKRKI